MDGLVQSIRSRARRPWFLGLVGLTVTVVGFLLVSGRGGPPALELVTVDADGGIHDRVTVKAGEGQTVASSDRGSVTRIPLTLAVRNSGGQPARPDHLELSLPKHLRLSTSAGRTLRGKAVPGNPLVRYRLPGPFPVIEPGSATPISEGDNLWLELTTSPVYCVVMADSVPEFLPAPESRNALSQIQIFYSFEGAELDRRQAGLLSVTLDPALLEREATEPPPTFPTELQNGGTPLPPMSALRYIGSTKTECGAPEQPIQLFSTLWETPQGGRFFTIDYGGVTRKYLFDLNRDDVIELEMWDAQGKGNFQASRKAQFAIPPFLMPGEGDPEQHDPNVFADVPRDSLGNYDRFRQTIAGGSRAIRPDANASQHRHRPLASSGERERDETTSSRDRSSPRPRIGQGGRPADPPARTSPRQDRPRRAEPTERAAPPAAAPEPPAVREPSAPRERPAQRRRTEPAEPTPPPEAPPRRPWLEPPERPAVEPEREPRQEEDGPRLLGVPVDSVSLSPTSDRPVPEARPDNEPARPSQPGTEPDAEPETERGNEPGRRGDSAAEPDAQPDDESEAAPEAERRNEPRSRDNPQAEPRDEPEADPDNDQAEPDARPEPDDDAGPDRERRRP